MFIKSIRNFRTSIKLEKPDTRNNKYIDEHFVGTYNDDDIKGFFGMYHGIKDEPEKFIASSAAKIAADEQAIYEFIQNAVDCQSSHFYIFYNEEYFLAINNGIPFTNSDVKAILNFGQSNKSYAEIGSFGVGFKLTHRLVGKDDGVDELIKEYKGPVIFSWSKKTELIDLLNNNIKLAYYNKKDPSYFENAAWLFKICLTNFPTNPDEKVKNLDYKDDILFSNEELVELTTYARTNLEANNINKNILNKGSLFFLKLGQGKKQYIDKNRQELEKGIAYSLNTFSKLSKIYINNEAIGRKPLKMIKDIIIPYKTDEFFEISPKKQSDIIINFGYYPKYKDGSDFINSPNFYNFFPMVSEIHDFRFMIHSNAFDNQVSRQELQKDNLVNRSLMFKIQEKLKIRFEKIKKKDTHNFLNIYANILLSKKPKKDWINDTFFSKLIEYLNENIPTKIGFQSSSDFVAIKKTKLPISPSEWGIEKDWFYWTDLKEDEQLIKEAQSDDKLALEKMSISSLIEKGDIDKINKWISETNDENFNLFINELEKDIPDNNFSDIKFLKCNDGNYYSINEIENNISVICVFEKIFEIKDILNELGLTTTEINISNYKNIEKEAAKKISYLQLINNKEVFNGFIKEATPGNNLSPKNKKRLFLGVKELRNISNNSIKEWELFYNRDKRTSPLKEIISPSVEIEKWLAKYQLIEKEFFKELEEYLLQEEDIYPSIIFPHWEKIIEVNNFNEANICDFYSSILEFYDDEVHRGFVLNDKAYIFTNEGFYQSSEVFYNELFSSTEAYGDLQSSIEKITGFKTPSKKILEYLTKNPFNTDDDKLIDHLSDCTLKQSEAYELLRFCKNAEVKIFSKGVFLENGDNIEWTCNVWMTQYFSDDSELINFITKHLDELLYLLPKGLQDFKSFDGIKRNQEPYEEIIALHKNIYDLADEFLPLLKHKEIIKQYLKNIENIKIKNKDSFNQTDFEYLVVSNLISYFEEDELEEIKEKILIYNDDNGNEFKITEIVSSNEAPFEVEDKKYNIKVSEILPESDIFTKAKIRDSIINNFKKLELPKTKLEKLFLNEIEEEDLAEKLADELLNSLDDSILETAEQVAFCLLYELQSGWNKFDDFQICASNMDTYKLNKVWYTKPYSFLSQTGAIGEQYKGLSKLLKLKDENPIFKVRDSCIFLYKPAFYDDGIFVCNYIDEDLDESKCIALLNFLFEEYNKRGKESRRDFEEIDNWSKLGDTETGKIIGFNPNNIIFIEDDEFLMADEVAPDWLQKWTKDQSKILFLKVLGIHFDDSDIINLRKSFYNKGELITIDEINGSTSLSAFLLENTLKWLVESEIWEDKVIDEPIQVVLLDAIIKKLEWDLEDYWSVNIEKLKDNSEEWDDEGYLNWREEDDSFEIRMYDDQIPYILKYENNILAEKNQDDFWYDDENEIFYANKNKSTQLLLQNAAEEDLFDLDTIKPLIQQGLVKVKGYEDRIEQLEAELQQYRQPKGDITRGTADSETMGAVLDETLNMVKEELEQDENYDCTGWDNSRFPKTLVQGVLYKQIPIKLIIRNCQRGRLHLIPKEWLLLSQPNTFLVLRLSKHKIEVIPEPLKELAESNNLFNMNFDLERLSTDGVTALSKAIEGSNIKYVGVGFVIDAPRYSRSIELNEIGLYITNLGDISSANEDEF